MDRCTSTYRTALQASHSEQVGPGSRRTNVIGEVSMSNDRTVYLKLYRTADGLNISATLTYMPTHKSYYKVIAHVGGLQPGEHKLLDT
jgi:hypothetical protein